MVCLADIILHKITDCAYKNQITFLLLQYIRTQSTNCSHERNFSFRKEIQTKKKKLQGERK